MCEYLFNDTQTVWKWLGMWFRGITFVSHQCETTKGLEFDSRHLHFALFGWRCVLYGCMVMFCLQEIGSLGRAMRKGRVRFLLW
jgi:hypothetical protein